MRANSAMRNVATHAPSGTPLALKVINIFDRAKRAQLIKEIQALYDSDWCVLFVHQETSCT